MFPHRLTDSRAYDIAQALLDGFNRHYQLFSLTSRDAKQRFERADWHGQQRAQRERIEFYDKRVDEAVARLQADFDTAHLSDDTWQQVKLHYIGLLVNHRQPELAETFFNSVTTKILHHRYFRNDFIFVRPAVSTEYIENDEPASQPTYRVTTLAVTACAKRCCASSTTFNCSGRLKTWAATLTPCWRHCASRWVTA